MDTWTSLASESFLGLTIHWITEDWESKKLTLACVRLEDRHTSQHLETVIMDIVKQYCKTGIVVAIVHDNAANMLAMKLPFQQYRCVAHTLQLAIRTALERVEPLVAKGRDLVTHFTKSSVAMAELVKVQKQRKRGKDGKDGKDDKDDKDGTLEEKALKPVTEVKTRWNSTYLMLQRLLLLKPYLNTVLINTEFSELLYSPSEWELLKELTEVLKPFYEATKLISGERYIFFLSYFLLAIRH